MTEPAKLARRRPKAPTALEEGAAEGALAADKLAIWRRQCRQDIARANALRLAALAAAEAGARAMQEAIAAAQRAERDIATAAAGLGRAHDVSAAFARNETERRLSRHLAALLKPLAAGRGSDFGELAWHILSDNPGEPWAEAERRATQSAIDFLTREDELP